MTTSQEHSGPPGEIVFGKQESWLKCRVPSLPCFLRPPQRPRLSPQVSDSSVQEEDPVSLAFACQAHRGWLPGLQVENDLEVVSGLRRSEAELIITSVVALVVARGCLLWQLLCLPPTLIVPAVPSVSLWPGNMWKSVFLMRLRLKQLNSARGPSMHRHGTQQFATSLVFMGR